MCAATPEPLSYLDASAVIKLIVAESESGALRAFASTQAPISSELILVEVPRAINRLSSGRRRSEQAALQEGLEAVMTSINLLELNREMLVLAGRLGDSYLRSLDAIHLVSAMSIASSIETFVTYDERQASAAAKAELPLAQPGLSGSPD